MDNPYSVKLISHLSASSIRDFMSCEAKAAYARVFVDVPQVALPVGMAAGVMFHGLMEKYGQILWKDVQQSKNKCIGIMDRKSYPNFGCVMMRQMLDGKIGCRGPGTKPDTIAWRADRLKLKVDEAHYLELVEEEKAGYVGMTYLLLEALRLQFTVPSDLIDLKFEYGIGKPQARMASPDKTWQFALHGSIDLVEYFPYGYNVVDYKSGWIIGKYKDRLNLIEDIQMSLYSYAMERITGQIPSGLIIQPLNFSKEDLDTHGPYTLSNLRINLPPRNSSAYFEELMKLGEDIYHLSQFIARKIHFSNKEKEQWEPKSLYAKKAGFKESVVETRYKPRIGPWCDSCQFVKLCVKDHPSDWERHSAIEQQVMEASTEIPIQQLVSHPSENKDQLELFEHLPPKTQYLRKSLKEIKHEMVQSGHFVTKAKIMPTLNKVKAMMKALGQCPCTDLDMFPLWILDQAVELLSAKKSIKDACVKCPYPQCTRIQKAPTN